MYNKVVGQLIVLLFIISFSSWAAPLCEFEFNTCPESFNGDTIVVPPNIIALSSKIFACNPTEVIEGLVDSGAPPSIMFVIDHSYSMMGLGETYPGNDQYGARFTVTRDLLDTIYGRYPEAEVGVVVFREVLYFDHRNNNLFVPLPGNGDQSYLPLIQLNSQVGGMTGLNAIRSVLETDTVIRRNNQHNINVECADLIYTPGFSTIGNTNINVAFAAAKEALKTARNPKDRQFIIFLSDGEPVGGTNRYAFVAGTDVATTFTAFFHNTSTVAPDSLVRMTQNIRTNGYSTTNPQSDIWVLRTNYQSLMDLMMTRIITPILTVVSGSATRVTINNLTTIQRSQDSSFLFAERFPLQADLTSFNISVTYHLQNNRTGVQRDTTINATFYVRRQTGATIGSDITSQCWEGPSMGLYYNGTQINAIRETNNPLEIRFFPYGTPYSAVPINVSNYQPAIDRETVNLTNSTTYWSRTFTQEINQTRPSGDGRLQHSEIDSIIIVYRNPKLPLDTLRIAVPFEVSNRVALERSAYFDRNADGFIDSIFVGLAGTFIPANIPEIVARIALPSHRAFQIDSVRQSFGGFALYVRETGSSTPQTGVTTQDAIRINQGILPSGGYLAGGSLQIQDRVAPVIISAYINTGASLVDTLHVQFSENVFSPIAFSIPYRFANAAAGPYVVNVEIPEARTQGSSYVAPVRSITQNFAFQTGDSVWINTAASIADSLDNRQYNSDNRRVLLRLRFVPYNVTVKANNNPFNPAKHSIAQMPQFVRSAYPSDMNGVLIMVEPEAQLRSAVELRGKISIYDVVKNPIIEDRPLKFDNVSKRLFFVWDGRNSKGRDVATGTYLAIVKMLDNQDMNQTKTIRIGVKR